MNHPFIAMRRTAVLGISTLLILVLAACGGPQDADGGNGAEGGNGAGTTATVADGTVEITADDLSFDADVIEASAGEAFTIVLANAEAVPHNLSVYVEEGGTEIARGDIINEGETDEIEVPALEPGEYFFVCDLHTAEMRGTLIVEG